ncbi:MAG: hypothetical protein V1776_01620 [Candidatus Diapherotrites archaeon]
MRFRGQTSVELLVITAVSLVILGALVGFTAEQLRIVQEQKSVKQAENSLQKIVDAANAVYAQGSGSSRSIAIVWPEGIDANQTIIEEKTIRTVVFSRAMYATAIPSLVGSLPTYPGYHILRVKAFDGFVAIGDVSLVASPSVLFAPLNQDENATHGIVITNAGGDATVTFSLDWNHSLVDVNISSSTDIIPEGEQYDLNVIFSSSNTAVGSYKGKLIIQGVFSGKTETLTVPITAAVAVGSNSDLVSYPSSLSLSTFYSDTNATTFQLCNVGMIPLSAITFTSSSGDAGDWVQGIDTISSIPPLDCTLVTVNVTPNTGLSVGTYTGSLFVSDYDGVNTLVVPITVNVNGMSGIFNWDWGTATKISTLISGYTLQNVGNVPIQLSKIKMRNWDGCDSADSTITQMQLNGNTVFSGIAFDGNWMDLVNVNLPVLTQWTSNSVTFSGNVNDESESFIADVLFSDGTVYTTARYGGSCLDTTAPGKVNDLLVSMGSVPKEVVLTFTYPGDDGMLGSVSSAILKYSPQPISDDTKFDAATSVTFNPPYENGGTEGSLSIIGYDVGLPAYFALKFVDENGNMGPLSNVDGSGGKPWNRFNYSNGDFDFTNMVYSDKSALVTDVNEFMITAIALDAFDPTPTMGIRIVEDNNANNGWIAYLEFDTSHLTDISIWYPTSATSVPTGIRPNYTHSGSWDISGGINLLDPTLVNSSFRYNGTDVNMAYPNHFYLISMNGLLDFNVVVDADNEVGFVIEGGIGPK